MTRGPARGSGRTRAGRLAALDRVLLHCEHALLAREDGGYAHAACVDVGVGEWPWTTLEYAEAVQRVRPSLRVIGVEHDPKRLAHAATYAAPGVEYRLGSFELPLRPDESLRLVRAMNVLRGYREDEVLGAQRRLGVALLPGGLLIEGSSSSDGGVICAHWLRKTADLLTREAMLFSSDFSQGFAPFLFRDWLPRDLRRHVRPGEPMFVFLQRWNEAFQLARVNGPRDAPSLFVRSSLILSEHVPGIVVDSSLLSQGCLMWRPPGGVPFALGT